MFDMPVDASREPVHVLVGEKKEVVVMFIHRFLFMSY